MHAMLMAAVVISPWFRTCADTKKCTRVTVTIARATTKTSLFSHFDYDLPLGLAHTTRYISLRFVLAGTVYSTSEYVP